MFISFCSWYKFLFETYWIWLKEIVDKKGSFVLYSSSVYWITWPSLYMHNTSIIEPHLRYCCSVWRCCEKTEIDRLQKLSNRASRIVTNSSNDTPSMPPILNLDWETIDDFINQKIKTIAFKSVSNLAPQYLINLFTRNSHSSSHNLRNTDSDVQIPKKKTSNGQKFFS